MSTEAIVTSTIAILGVFGTLLGFVIRQSVCFGKMQEKLETNEKLDEEERERSSEKFSEIFSRLNNAEGSSRELFAKIDNQTQGLERVESKMDRLEQMIIGFMKEAKND